MERTFEREDTIERNSLKKCLRERKKEWKKENRQNGKKWKEHLREEKKTVERNSEKGLRESAREINNKDRRMSAVTFYGVKTLNPRFCQIETYNSNIPGSHDLHTTAPLQHVAWI